MSLNLKKLQQTILTGSGTQDTLVTAGAAPIVVTSIHVANYSVSNRTIKLWHDGVANTNYLLPAATILAGGSANFQGAILLEPGDTLKMEGSAATALTVTVYGEVDPKAVSAFGGGWQFLDANGKTGVLSTTSVAAIDDITDVAITTPADNEVLAYDNGSSTWINQTAAEAGLVSTAHVYQDTIVVAGALTAVTNPIRYYNNTGSARTISKVAIAVNTAPVGAAIIVDVNKDGTTLFTNQAHRPTIADGANTGNTTDIDVSEWGDGTYLNIDVDQIGSGTAGSNLTVMIVYTQA